MTRSVRLAVRPAADPAGDQARPAISGEPAMRTATRRLGGWLLAAGPALVFTLFFCYPVAVLLHRGLTGTGGFGVGAVWDVVTRPRIRRILFFTVWQALASAALCLLLGLPTAYVLYRKRFPGRALVRALLTAPFVLPTVVIGLAFRALLSSSGPLGAWHLDQTVWAILAAHTCLNLAVVVRTVGAAWTGMDPRPAEAAASLGAGPFRVFRTVTLPALAPAVTAAGVLVFLFCATSFGVIQILGGSRYGTVETEIYHQTMDNLDLKTAAALSIVQIVLVALTLVVAGRFHRPGRRATVLVAPSRLRPVDLPAAVTAVVAGTVVLAAPITLVIKAFRVDGHWSLANFAALGTLGNDNVLFVPLTVALRDSLVFALVGAAGSVTIGCAVAVVVTGRTRRRGRRALESLVTLPLGVSAVTVGLGFLIAFNQPPVNFRGSIVLVPIAQGLLAIPLVVRMLLPVLDAVDDRLRQAAAVLGSAPLRVWTAVDLPLAARALAGAFAFAFAVVLGEFGAASFLARPATPTLPVEIGLLLAHPSSVDLGRALAASTVLAALCVVAVALIDVLPGRGRRTGIPLGW